MKDKTLVILGGPSGIGKTSTGIKLAKSIGTEIISADSRQVYKELSIGTAVPSPAELNAVKHHLIQHISIFDTYNASRYEEDVLNLLPKLFQKFKLVFMVGGSGLYIDAVYRGIDEFPDVNPELRKSLIDKLETEGIENLRFELKKLDPVYYKEVDLHNPKRILKAIEITLMTGKPYSSQLSHSAKCRGFNVIMIGLDMEREVLYERINKRVLAMIENGLIEEARKNLKNAHLNSLNTVGYKEMFEFLRGERGLESAIERIQANTRKYARKQLTWFRRYENLKWFHPEQLEEMQTFIEQQI